MAPFDVRDVLAKLRQLGLSLPRIHYFPVISSTQDEASRLAARGAVEGTLVVAGRQTQGRGRLGRGWYSPMGAGLYASIVLRPPAPPSRWPVLSVIAGTAVVEELERLGAPEPRLKWPNDALIKGKKVMGILVEAFPDHGFAILGLGLNVSFSGTTLPEEIHAKATDLEQHLPRERDLALCAARVVRAVFDSYIRSLPHLGFDPQRAERFLWTTDTVKVGSISGRVRGLTSNGELILVDEKGHEVRAAFGEVTDVSGD